jgi:fibronectin type 3 domain-containing protein
MDQMKKFLLACFLFVSSLALAANPCGMGGVQVATGLTVLTYVDTSVSQGTTYTYGVTATDVNGLESICSNRVTPFVPNTPPPPPHQVTLTWNASTTSGVTYNVYKITPPNPPTGLAQKTQ